MSSRHLEHGRAKHMASIVGFDLKLTVHLHHLVKIHRHHFLHAVFDHRRCEEVLLSLPVHSNFSHVFEKYRSDRLGGDGHVDGAIVADHLGHEGQGAAVVQVEMGDDDAVQVLSEWLICCNVGKVWKPSVILKTSSTTAETILRPVIRVTHVHPTVKHHILST